MTQQNNLLRPAALVLAAILSLPTAVLADEDCAVPVSEWENHDAALRKVAERWGLEPQRLRIDDGCYQVRALDGDGNRLFLLLDPSTLEPVELTVKFKPGAKTDRYLGSVRPVADGALGEDERE